MPQYPKGENVAEKVRRLNDRDLNKNAFRYLVKHESLILHIALEDDQPKLKLINVERQASEMGLHYRIPISF
jgi:hypothetical protein